MKSRPTNLQRICEYAKRSIRRCRVNSSKWWPNTIARRPTIARGARDVFSGNLKSVSLNFCFSNFDVNSTILGTLGGFFACFQENEAVTSYVSCFLAIDFITLLVVLMNHFSRAHHDQWGAGRDAGTRQSGRFHSRRKLMNLFLSTAAVYDALCNQRPPATEWVGGFVPANARLELVYQVKFNFKFRRTLFR